MKRFGSAKNGEQSSLYKSPSKQMKSDPVHHGKHTDRRELSDVWTFIVSFAYHVPGPDQ